MGLRQKILTLKQSAFVRRGLADLGLLPNGKDQPQKPIREKNIYGHSSAYLLKETPLMSGTSHEHIDLPL
eukprot:546298-Pelagomonas_calceolata.AAC.2